MKVKERAVARGLEKLYPQLGTLEEPEDQFSPFDFECKKYIIEVKCRSQAWDPWFIEAIKYNSNMEVAKNRKKDFIRKSYNTIELREKRCRQCNSYTSTSICCLHSKLPAKHHQAIS